MRIHLDKVKTLKLLHRVEAMLDAPGLAHGIRSLAGELSWVAGIAPRLRPFVSMLWAAATAADQHGESNTARHRPKGAVFQNMVLKPLVWIRAFLRGERMGVQRVHRAWDAWLRPVYWIRTDASTTGLGGILLSTDGRPLRYWAVSITEEVATFLGAKIGESSFMTTFELLGLFVGLIRFGDPGF